MKLLKGTYITPLVIVILGILLLIPFAGKVHLFDWDEIIFAESAREMLISGDYLTVTINYEPFYEKPPMFIWFQVLSMKLFGINEFAARFPNAICGILTLLTLFFAGKKIKDQNFGKFWALSFGTAILPFFYFRTGIIDPWFNLFIFLGILFFIFYLLKDQYTRRVFNLTLSAIFLGLAVLTKGPVAILIVGLSFLTYLVIVRGKITTSFYHVLLFVSVFLLVGGSWFVVAILKGNFEVVKDFIHYQAGLFSDDFAGHSGFPGFHIVILLFGVFPASVFLFAGITRKKEDSQPVQTFRIWMYILLILILVLFSIVETKLVHYSSMAYYPISFLAGWALYQWSGRRIEFRKWQLILLGMIGFIFLLITTLIPWIMTDPQRFISSFPALITPYVEGVLMSEVNWTVLDYLPALLLLVGMLLSLIWLNKRDSKGLYVIHVVILLFTFTSMILFAPKVEKMIQGPAIAFMQDHSGPDEDVAALGFPSFAPYFYGKWMPGDLDHEDKADWFADGNRKVPIYVVMKADNAPKVLDRYPMLERIGEEGGFVFGKYDP